MSIRNFSKSKSIIILRLENILFKRNNNISQLVTMWKGDDGWCRNYKSCGLHHISQTLSFKFYVWRHVGPPNTCHCSICWPAIGSLTALCTHNKIKGMPGPPHPRQSPPSSYQQHIHKHLPLLAVGWLIDWINAVVFLDIIQKKHVFYLLSCFFSLSLITFHYLSMLPSIYTHLRLPLPLHHYPFFVISSNFLALIWNGMPSCSYSLQFFSSRQPLTSKKLEKNK